MRKLASEESPDTGKGDENMNIQNIKVFSSAFESNGTIPGKYTCDGENINPPLEFEGIPEEAESLVLIVDDPDAPNENIYSLDCLEHRACSENRRRQHTRD